MRRTGRALQFALIAGGLAACGSSSTGLPAGFECLGQALPTTAPALVNVTGMVTSDVLSPKPVAHAFVYGFRTGDTTHLAGDTTNTPGQYSVAISTGGTPVIGYLAGGGRRRLYRERRAGQRDGTGDGEWANAPTAHGQRARQRDHADGNTTLETHTLKGVLGRRCP